METEYAWETLLDVSDLDKIFNELFESGKINTTETLQKLFKGEAVLDWKTIKDMGKTLLLQDFIDIKNMIVIILLLIILCCILQNIEEIFTKNGIGKMAEFVMMLAMSTIVLKGFFFAGQIVNKTSIYMLQAIELIVPAYMITVGSVAGLKAAGGFWQIILLAVTVSEEIIVKIIIPAAHIMVLLIVLDNILEEDHFAPLIQLIQKGIILTLRTSFSVVAGLGMIENMVFPTMGTINRSLLEKTISIIPGIGEVSDAVASMLTGSAILIKNTIGAFGLIMIILSCTIPVLRIGLIAIGMKTAAAFGAVFGKNQLIKCAMQVSEGCFILVRIMLTIGALFFLLIAMIGFSTNNI